MKKKKIAALKRKGEEDERRLQSMARLYYVLDEGSIMISGSSCESEREQW